MSVDLQEKRDVKLAPSKRWVNWWRAPTDGWMAGTNIHVPKGGLLSGTQIWPSREIAQQKAIDEDRADRLAGFVVCEYLGAWPEGKSPDGARP